MTAITIQNFCFQPGYPLSIGCRLLSTPVDPGAGFRQLAAGGRGKKKALDAVCYLKITKKPGGSLLIYLKLQLIY